MSGRGSWAYLVLTWPSKAPPMSFGFREAGEVAGIVSPSPFPCALAVPTGIPCGVPWSVASARSSGLLPQGLLLADGRTRRLGAGRGLRAPESLGDRECFRPGGRELEFGGETAGPADTRGAGRGCILDPLAQRSRRLTHRNGHKQTAPHHVRCPTRQRGTAPGLHHPRACHPPQSHRPDL